MGMTKLRNAEYHMNLDMPFVELLGTQITTVRRKALIELFYRFPTNREKERLWVRAM